MSVLLSCAITFALWYACAHFLAYLVSYGAEDRRNTTNEMWPFMVLAPILLTMLILGWLSMKTTNILRWTLGKPADKDVGKYIP
jgi:hypothetical protein